MDKNSGLKTNKTVFKLINWFSKFEIRILNVSLHLLTRLHVNNITVISETSWFSSCFIQNTFGVLINNFYRYSILDSVQFCIYIVYTPRLKYYNRILNYNILCRINYSLLCIFVHAYRIHVVYNFEKKMRKSRMREQILFDEMKLGRYFWSC